MGYLCNEKIGILDEMYKIADAAIVEEHLIPPEATMCGILRNSESRYFSVLITTPR
jgi:hypothetical protein